MGENQHNRWAIEIHTAPDNHWLTVADCAKDFSQATIRLRSGRQGLPTRQALHYPTDQIILANRLARHEALILHAAGVLWNGRGYIFGGRSGIGKTTLARIWRQQGATLLNDDRVIVRWQDGQARLYASPWHGEEEMVTDQSAVLGGIFHLAQSTTPAAKKLQGAGAVAALLSTAVAPFYSASGINHLLTVAEQICHVTPTFQLAFKPEPQVVPFCLAALGGLNPGAAPGN